MFHVPFSMFRFDFYQRVTGTTDLLRILDSFLPVFGYLHSFYAVVSAGLHARLRIFPFSILIHLSFLLKVA